MRFADGAAACLDELKLLVPLWRECVIDDHRPFGSASKGEHCVGV